MAVEGSNAIAARSQSGRVTWETMKGRGPCMLPCKVKEHMCFHLAEGSTLLFL